MTTDLATNRGDTDIIEQVIVGGDLEKLSPAQRTVYYARVCETLGLNPLTKPFDYIRLSGKLVLYATRTATDQLAKQAKLSLEPVRTERIEDVYVVTAKASDPTGRTVTNVGAVEITGLKGAALANAIMKAHTKSYRRSTLSFCGLGWLDETEIETIKDARPVVVSETGEIVESPSSPVGKLGMSFPIFTNVKAVLEWGHETFGLSSRDMLGILGVDNMLQIEAKYGSLTKAAKVLLANVPQGADVKGGDIAS